MNKSKELYKQKKDSAKSLAESFLFLTIDFFVLTIDFCCERFARIRILFVSA